MNERLSPLEARAIQSIEEKFLTEERNNWVILLEDIETRWFWEERELRDFDDLWNEGYSLWDISEMMECKFHEALLIMLERKYRAKIKNRKGGINGTIRNERR